MGFSRQEDIERNLKTQLRRARIMSKGNINSDFDISHPDWVRDGSKDHPTNAVMNKAVTKIAEDHTTLAIQRRHKLLGKQ